MKYIILAIVFAVIIIIVSVSFYHYGRYVSRDTMRMLTKILHENVLLIEKAVITDKILRKYYLETKQKIMNDQKTGFKDLKGWEQKALNEVFQEHSDKFKGVLEQNAASVAQKTFGKTNKWEGKN